MFLIQFSDSITKRHKTFLETFHVKFEKKEKKAALSSNTSVDSKETLFLRGDLQPHGSTSLMIQANMYNI